jgi:glutathione S-transferase
MKLYFSPGACSLADHIALHEAGLHFDRIKVDLRAHKTEDGQDYYQINPKGYVPALELDGGDILTENIAILSWAAEQKPALIPPGELGRTKLLEMLAFISTEIHKSFKPYFSGASETDKAAAGQAIGKRLGFLAERMTGDYLFGGTFTVADAYLFVMLRWAQGMGIAWPEPLPAYFERVKAREAVRLSLEHEGLT